MLRYLPYDTFIAQETLPDLLNEYADECATPGLPVARELSHCHASYRSLEAAGVFAIIGAFSGVMMRGFISVIVTDLPKYTEPMAATESYFVAAAYRHYGFGARLLAGAEGYAKEKGAAGLLVSAPADSRLNVIMGRSGYAPSNTVYMKALT